MQTRVVVLVALAVLAGCSAAPVVPTEPATTPTSGPTDTTTTDAAAGTETAGLDTSTIEAAIHARVNEIRAERGLGELRYDEAVAGRAAAHSDRMADAGTIFHSDLRTQYGETCTSMGENVAFTYAYRNVRTDWAGVVNYHGNETAIAHGIVEGWMHSEGHRENLLRDGWTREGIGVTVGESEHGVRVYATQAFCG